MMQKCGTSRDYTNLSCSVTHDWPSVSHLDLRLPIWLNQYFGCPLDRMDSLTTKTYSFAKINVLCRKVSSLSPKILLPFITGDIFDLKVKEWTYFPAYDRFEFSMFKLCKIHCMTNSYVKCLAKVVFPENYPWLHQPLFNHERDLWPCSSPTIIKITSELDFPCQIQCKKLGLHIILALIVKKYV